jgi:hypothetical protein
MGCLNRLLSFFDLAGMQPPRAHRHLHKAELSLFVFVLRWCTATCTELVLVQ